MVAPGLMWLLSFWNVVSLTKALIFQFYFILTNRNLSLNSQMWLVGIVLPSESVDALIRSK